MTPDNSRDYPRCIVHSSAARSANANMQLPTPARMQAGATARALPYLKDQTTSTNLCKLLVGTCITLFMLLSLYKPAIGATKMPFEEESAELEQQLVEAYKAMGGSYTPRTEHLNPDGSAKFVNRLIREDSPYLIQHAHNPVNWYSWGEEAMDIAFAEDKPIFMSIGYATCHWCHVMERESFENEEIAEFLNSNFISIKVDREQRPDVDSTYMTAVQMMTGGGGWPLSSFLNIKATPFYGGTYFPPEAFLDLLKQIDRVWRDQRDELENQAQKVAVALVDANTLKSTARDIGERDIALAVKQLLTGYDDLQGGFGDAPKFPREPALYLLLEQAQRHQDLEALQAAHFTLERIAAGGIHDQIAGGFHRYATDNDWLIPHFEKMLYNQAALTRNYVQSWKLTGDQEHARIARRVLDYVMREMTSETGVFYSATDADSAGGEGEFFIWTPAEISEVLSKEDAELAAQVWGVTEAGNFEQANILHMDGPIRDIADTLAMDIAELTKRLDSMSEALLLHRQDREAPLRDEKILTSWNAMMITAFAEAGEALEEEKYLTAATTAMEQLLQINGREGDLLWRTHFDGTSSVDAGQADYANLAEALITLTDITGDERWLNKARALVVSMDAQFWDEEHGAYFMGSVNSGGAALPIRPKERYDNATPGGNSVALRVLARLAARTGEESYRERAYELLSAFADSLNQSPSAFGYLLTAVNELEYGESGHRRFAGRGKVAVKAYLNDKNAVEPVVQVHIDIAEGWHINANKPLQEYLIGTTFSDAAGETLNDVAYPQAKLATLGFERSELALYEGRLSIEIPLSQLGIDLDDAPIKISQAANGADMRVAQLALNLQACSDEVCLAPETLKLNVSLANHTL